MHAKECAALPAQPIGMFRGYECLYSTSLDALQIYDDAYPVAGPVTAVKVQQIGTGKPGAGKAKPMSAGGTLPAILDGTTKARVRLVPVASPATGTGPAIPHVCSAQAAIYAARCDEHCVTSMNTHVGVCHGLRLPLRHA